MDIPDAGIYFVLLVLCLLSSAFFSAAKTAMQESRKNKLEKMVEEDLLHAAGALQILENPQEMQFVVQVGLVLTTLLTGLLAGIGLAPVLQDLLNDIPLIEPYIQAVSFLAGFFIIAYFTLLLADFFPQKIALQNPENMFLQLLPLLEKTAILFQPLITLLTLSFSFLSILFGFRVSKADNVTEDEIKDLIEQGTEDGTFEKAEQDMVDRIFRMSDQTAYSLMTPRTQLFWLDLEDTVSYNLRLIQENPDTIFPVGRDNLDDFAGVLHAKDLLNASLHAEITDFTPYIRKPLFIPRSMETFRILEKFRESTIHEAVVLDEYGGVIGFITLRDIVSEIIGDIADNTEPEPLQITPRDENSWLVDGLLDIDDFKEKFDLEKLPDEDRSHFQTMGGFLTSYFGYIPKVAEKCEWNDFSFEIVDMDRARIDKILVTFKKEKPVTDKNETEEKNL